MKSIIEQASSIMKAIEKAWDQAAKPKEFSIKIFEQEERNFFGMSTKPAKIGIFFNDKPVAYEKPTSKPRQEIKECRPSFAASSTKNSGEYSKATEGKPTFSKVVEDKSTDKIITKPSSQSEQKSHRQSAPQAKQDHQAVKPRTEKQIQPINEEHKQKTTEEKTSDLVKTTSDKRRTPATWNDTMVATTHNWLKKTLSLMNMPTIDFNSEVVGKNLKLTFNAPLIADAMHEKQLFRSFAHLIMSSLRNQYKQEIKDLKVILIRPE